MKTNIKFLSGLLILTLLFYSCKKDKKNDHTPTNNQQNYTSLTDFYKKNGVKKQVYRIDASTGGSFTSPKGTVVTVPANCFVTAGNVPASGEVTIEFKDIYSKSDMLLSDVPTNFFDGTPLKSGGEFFINALLDDQPLQIAAGMNIQVEQPLNGLAQDTAMQAMILLPKDTIQGGNNGGGGWYIDPNSDLLWNSSSYVFTLYQFDTNNGAGTWCNSDNSSYFQAYPTTSLTVNKINGYNMDVFLVFKNVSSMVHVYENGNEYPYSAAPLGFECTVVAIGVKEGKLYASFNPVTITSNLSINPVFVEISTEDFKTQINALN
jgi:hypothetical protein